MRAAICTKYGQPEVFRIEDIEKPIPKNNEVLVKIHATSVTASDCTVRGFKISKWSLAGFMMRLIIGFNKPRNPVLGMILAGEIETTGNTVTNLNIGDRIFGWTIKSGIQLKFGTYAEYICIPHDAIIAKITNDISYEEAAAIPYGALIALHYLKKANTEKDKKVMIYGASGAIGSAAVQLAKYLGAEVTGVCSTKNMELMQSLGADFVIDYTKDKLANPNKQYDIILDAVGKRKSSKLKVQCKKALTPKGIYISVDDGSPKLTLDNLNFLTNLVEAGLFKPLIDKVYQLEEIIEAHKYVDQGHKKGNVIITLKHDK